jgi:phosphatidylglycerophosphate synthase
MTGLFFKPKDPRAMASGPDVVTALRLAGSLVFFVLAAVRRDPVANFVGLGIHWLGDLADGFYARRTRQETIFGAEIDIIADRVETMFFYVNFINFRPAISVPAALYIVDFAFVDFYLSYQFLKYGLISPNYFDRVDRRTYLLNFSPAGKFMNSTVVTLLLIFLPGWRAVAAAFAAGLIGVKTYSIVRLSRIKKDGPS